MSQEFHHRLPRIRPGELKKSVEATRRELASIRSGIRMIAEREGYHARIFERRMKDLGVECKAQVTEDEAVAMMQTAIENPPEA